MNIGGDWYHFNNLGYASSGWEEIGGNWYYLDTVYGVLFDTVTPDGYYVDEDGICR